MGMFDSVLHKCPNCGVELEWQSKVGQCLLNSYQIDSVPVGIAFDLNGSCTICYQCSNNYTLILDYAPPKYVAMRIE